MSGLGIALALAFLVLLASTPLAAAHGAWSQIGPPAGTVDELLPAPGAPGTIYAIAQDGSIFRSSDGAASWMPTGHLDIAFYFAPTVMVDPSDASTLYFTLSSLALVWKSTDGGAHWSHLPLPAPSSIFDQPGALVRPPSAPGTVYVALDMTTLYRSGDGGASWTALPGPDPKGFGIETLAVDAYDANRLYASDGVRTFYSKDGGHHWSVTDSAQLSGASKLVADPSQPLAVYAFLYESSNDPVYKSLDGGVTWASVSANLPRGGLDLEVGRSGAVYVFVSGLLYASADGGKSWQQVVAQFPFAVDSGAGGRLYGATPSGIALSTDRGRSWTAADHGFSPSSFLQLVVDPRQRGTLYGVANQYQETVLSNLTVTTDGGATWTITSESGNGPTPGAEIQRIAFDAPHGVLFVLSWNGVIFRSADRGATWQLAGGSNSFGFSKAPIDLALAPGNPRALYVLLAAEVSCPPTGGFATTSCAQYQLFTSRNRGRNWLARGSWLLADPTQDSPAGRLWIDPFAASTVYAGVTAGAKSSSFLKSSDGGTTWSQLLGQPVGAAVFDPAIPGTLYISVPGDRRQVLKSTDGGGSWLAVNGGGLPHGTDVTAFAFGAATLYAGTAGGQVFATVDGARTWQAVATGLPGAPVLSLAAGGQGTVYAGLEGGGVYALTASRP
jgi:photosystem II stability/assembly factor-like uncharacterized protein